MTVLPSSRLRCEPSSRLQAAPTEIARFYTITVDTASHGGGSISHGGRSRTPLPLSPRHAGAPSRDKLVSCPLRIASISLLSSILVVPQHRQCWHGTSHRRCSLANLFLSVEGDDVQDGAVAVRLRDTASSAGESVTSSRAVVNRIYHVPRPRRSCNHVH